MRRNGIGGVGGIKGVDSFTSQVMISAAGFSEKYFSSNPDTIQGRNWGLYRARQLRYDVFWSMYEQNIYRKIHMWASSLKEEYDLYENVRSIYSPAYRGGEFWPEHIYGGVLDMKAGDGKSCNSAIPILTDNPAVRETLALIWEWSNFAIQKDVFTRFGAVMGDVGMAIDDDPDRQKVTFKVIHPRMIYDLDRDPQGNCRSYDLRELRPDPRWQDMMGQIPEVTYREIAYRQGDRVVFETFLDGEHYDWRDYDPGQPAVGPQWTEDYGFVPFVFNQHRDMGLGYGWAEFQPSFGKMLELDETVSNIGDQIGKLVRAPWLMAGITKEEFETAFSEDGEADDDTDDEKSAGRAKNDIPIIFASDPKARPFPLVAPLPLAEAVAFALSILKQVEADHPEIAADMASSAGDASGRALRVARQKVEQRVRARRVGYDNALVRAQMMAISIGAQKGYPGFEAFSADSYANGELKHSIGERPVFAFDPLDHLEEVQARANAVATMVQSGMTLETAMKRAGYSEDEIDEELQAQDKADKKALKKAADMAQQFVDNGKAADQRAAQNGPGGPQDGSGPPPDGKPSGDNGKALAKVGGDSRASGGATGDGGKRPAVGANGN